MDTAIPPTCGLDAFFQDVARVVLRLLPPGTPRAQATQNGPNMRRALPHTLQEGEEVWYTRSAKRATILKVRQ